MSESENFAAELASLPRGTKSVKFARCASGRKSFRKYVGMIRSSPVMLASAFSTIPRILITRSKSHEAESVYRRGLARKSGRGGDRCVFSREGSHRRISRFRYQ